MRILAFVITFLSLTIPSFAQSGNETITITTYYPSPHGVYGILRLYPRSTQPEQEKSFKGDLYYDLGTDDPTNRPEGVYVYNGSNWTLTNLGGGSPSGNTYTVEIRHHCTYICLTCNCRCPESISSSPGPIPVGAKVISCSSLNSIHCDVTGAQAALCNATISGNTINVQLTPPPPDTCHVTGWRDPEIETGAGTSACNNKFSIATVTYGN